MMHTGEGEAWNGRNIAAFSLILFMMVAGFLSYRLHREELFVDEAAFISQTYFWDMITTGRIHDALWLEYPAYDLPPLPKYLIGATLQACGIARVDRHWAIAWYSNIHERRFLSDRMLHVARWPSAILGATGCVLVFLLGFQGVNWRTGALAAVLLAVNPLYRLHAMRAMADVPAETFILATSALGLLTWKRIVNSSMTISRTVILGALLGCLGGLAVLAKLNGGLGLMILASWTLLGLVIVHRNRRRVLGFLAMMATAGVVSLLTFVALNPFVWSHPERVVGFPLASAVDRDGSIAARLALIVRHRFEVPRDQQVLFPHNALTTPSQKVATLLVQGSGRFGPLGPLHSDSTRRFDVSQDWGAILWFPMVISGCVVLISRGCRQQAEGRPPAAWCLVIMFAVSVITVGWFLPLAWDRFFLSIQAGCALMAAAALVSLRDRAFRHGRSG